MPVGPQLPASLREKRKRDRNDHGSSDKSSSDSDTGPSLPPGLAEPTPKKPRQLGPSLPPPSYAIEADVQSTNEEESSDNDDDFGPSLPPTGTKSSGPILQTNAIQREPTSPAVPAIKRDDWMMVPPSGGDWTGRVDPTKLKNRKFNTGKGAKGPPAPNGDASAAWHETPQEKQARLQREMMGIKDTNTGSPSTTQLPANKVDAETAKRLKEYNKARGPSMYEAHSKSETTEKDDDPSARAFDREKDIGGGLQINATQRRDMMKKASDFSTRFSGAKYL